MIRAIVSASMRFRVLVIAAAAALLVLGVVKLGDSSVDVLPEFAPTTVEIQTEALGLSAAEVEQLITVPMEQDLLVGVAFLDDVRSESLPGLSRILLVFEPGTDIFRARQVVAERLTQAHALPNVSKPPQMLQPLSATNRVMMIGASTDKLSAIEMGVLARWTIAPKLSGVEGVANVSVWGFRDRQLQVRVDPKKLRDSDVSLVQVIETAGNALWFSPLSFVEASTPGTGGFIDTPNQRIGVQHLSPIDSAADLAKVRVQETEGRALQLGDIASVVEDHQPLIGDARVSDGGEGDLIFVVEKLPGADTLAVTDGLEQAIKDMGPGLAGVTLDPTVYAPAGYIEHVRENIVLLTIIALILIALAIVAFIMRWRLALVAFVVVPVALMVAALVLSLLGTRMNLMVLTGLVAALVVIIDEAVSGADGIARRLRERRDGESVASAIFTATLNGRRAGMFAAAIIAVALIPLLVFEGVVGSFLPDVAGAYIVAILAAALVAITLTPALGMLLLRGQADVGDDDQTAGTAVRSAVSPAVTRMVGLPTAAIIGGAVLIVGAVVAAPFLDKQLLPTLKEQQTLIRWDGSPGTSLTEMNRITARARQELMDIPGVTEVGAHVGRAVTSDSSANVNSAELWVTLTDGADHDATMRAIDDVVAGYPGLSSSIGSFSNIRVDEVLAEKADGDVVVRIYGEDDGVLAKQATIVRETVTSIGGVDAARVVQPVLQPTLEVEVDLDAAQAAGIKPGDVRRAAATLLGGLVVGNLFEQQKVFEVVVWGSAQTRQSISSVRDLVVDTPDGRSVRLGDVADVRIAPNQSVIKRQGVSRYMDVALDVNGRGNGDVAADARKRLAELSLPLEYHTAVFAEEGQPVGKIIGVAIAALVGIILLLQAFFGSWRLAGLAFAMLPVALSGGVLAALVTGGDVSIGTITGFFAVLAISVRAVMMLMDRWRDRQRGGDDMGADAVRDGVLDRVVPLTITIVATVLAMLAAVILGGQAGMELIRPLAVVVIGGLITLTLVLLFVLPPLYLAYGVAAQAEVIDDEAFVGDYTWTGGSSSGAAQANAMESGS